MWHYSGSITDRSGDGIVLVFFVAWQSLSQSPGAIAFTVSHDYWEWTEGGGEGNTLN